MEKEGLVRCIQYLSTHDVTIDVIVTERHVQIKKYIKDNLPKTDHRFDVWHIAKGMCFLLKGTMTPF